MSQAFPTHKQFVAQVRAEKKAEYPPETALDRQLLEDCVQMSSDVDTWLKHLAKLIEQGIPPEQQVLDTLTSEQLYTLKKHYAPRESLDWYIPAFARTHKGLDAPKPLEAR